MLDDKEILPLCRMWARRFLHQAKHFGGSDHDIYNELTNIGYSAAKPLRTIKGASTWIMWVLIREVKMPRREERQRLSNARTDGRYSTRSTEPSPLETMQAREESQRLLKAVAALSDGERALIYRYYKDDATLQDIANECEKSTTWAMNRIREIIGRLRELMGE